MITIWSHSILQGQLNLFTPPASPLLRGGEKGGTDPVHVLYWTSRTLSTRGFQYLLNSTISPDVSSILIIETVVNIFLFNFFFSSINFSVFSTTLSKSRFFLTFSNVSLVNPSISMLILSSPESSSSIAFSLVRRAALVLIWILLLVCSFAYIMNSPSLLCIRGSPKLNGWTIFTPTFPQSSIIFL